MSVAVQLVTARKMIEYLHSLPDDKEEGKGDLETRAIVVQSIVSLTSLLRSQLVKCFTIL